MATVIVESAEIKRFLVDCFTTAGADVDHADQLADNLVAADLRGHYSHGLNRLEMYVCDLMNKACEGSGVPKIVNDRPSTAWVDGGNLVGPVVGNFCMKLAIQKAKQTGIGWVTARMSNHFGIAGYYAMQAMRQGLLGMAFTNTSPVTVPTRSAKPALGTNPISLAAPGNNGDEFVLDMATTAVAFGKVELSHRKNEDIPLGWALDGNGQPTTKPDRIMQDRKKDRGGLCPLGGDEVTSGYKGYGLCMMVEIFCGILSGGSYGPHVRKWMETDGAADLGQTFVAVDPSGFAEGFTDRFQQFMDEMRSLETAGGETRHVLVPGDPERSHIEECEKLGGIPYHPNQIANANEWAKKLKVHPPSQRE